MFLIQPIYQKSLQVLRIEKQKTRNVNKIKCSLKKNVWETSFFASFRKASLTVEAAILMPIFIMLVCAFLWFIMIFRMQITIQETMWELAEEVSGYAYVYERVRNLGNDEKEYIILKDSGIERLLVGGITGEYIEERIISKLKDKSGIAALIKGGIQGISVKGSALSFPDANGAIDLVVMYEVENPFLPASIGTFNLVQRCYIKAWTGYDFRDEGQPEDMVYVTETGKVYHLFRDCTYLQPDIMFVAYNMGNVRLSGKPYSPCEICIGDTVHKLKVINVYITTSGTKYHKDISCRTLKRTVYEISINEAREKYGAVCGRCAKRLEGN